MKKLISTLRNNIDQNIFLLLSTNKVYLSLRNEYFLVFENLNFNQKLGFCIKSILIVQFIGNKTS